MRRNEAFSCPDFTGKRRGGRSESNKPDACIDVISLSTLNCEQNIETTSIKKKNSNNKNNLFFVSSVGMICPLYLSFYFSIYAMHSDKIGNRTRAMSCI